MSELAATPFSGNAPGAGHEALTPEAIEAVLADFRAWLEQAAALPAPGPPPEAEPIDLHTLLGQFMALRHEVNLQTRATRAQQETTGETLQQLQQALDSLRQARTAQRDAERDREEETLRPLLKTLVDVHDALALAQREVQRTQEQVLAALAPVTEWAQAAAIEQAQDSSAALDKRPSIWARLFGSSASKTEEESADAARFTGSPQKNSEEMESIQQSATRVQQLLGSILAGYTMSLQRLERTLEQSGLEPIPCVGQVFDPEQMEVVATVTDQGRAAGKVVEEVRRGYLWRGRVFRFAQVSVARSS
jgi:molecular chaperone GrpE